MLGSGLAPRRVQGLIQVLHKVSGLSDDEEHVPGVSSQSHHLLRVDDELFEGLGGCALGGSWRRVAERNDRNLVRHEAKEVWLLRARKQCRDVWCEGFPHGRRQYREGIQSDEAVAFQCPGS